jgi:catalase
MSKTQHFTNATGAPVADNTNTMTAGPRGPALLQDIWLTAIVTGCSSSTARNSATISR